MATSATPMAAVRAAFSGLIDYAGLFPPAQLGMREAVAEFTGARRGPHAWMLGRFIVPESRVRELVQTMPEPFPVSVILDAGNDARMWFQNVQAALARVAEARKTPAQVEMLEVPLPRLLSLRETYDAAIGQYAAAAVQAGTGGLPSFIELPRDERWAAQLPGAAAAMKRHKLGAKLRCGGMSAGDIPPAHEVATFLGAVSEEDVPFKATAGLHHPLRGYSEDRGFVMHGFLNLLAAAALARAAEPDDELVALLQDEDARDFHFEPDGLVWKDRPVSTNQLHETRMRGLTSYGSCSFSEPVTDLQALDMIA